MNEDETVRARRRREALDMLAFERQREEALLPQLENALRDARAWRVDASVIAGMEAADVDELRAAGFLLQAPAGDASARLEQRVTKLRADLEESRRRQAAYERFAAALGES